MISSKFLSLLILCLTLLFTHDYSLSHLLGFVFACILLNSVRNTAWVLSQRLRWMLQKQGIKGPKPSIIYGNVPQMQRIQATVAKAKAACGGEFVAHDYTSTLFPYFEQWRKEYGSVYTYSTGDKQHLYVNKPELVKEMNQSNTLDLGKPSYVTKRLAPLLGNGILRSNGQTWVQQRKIVAPEFFMDKVKCMVGLMVDSAQPLLKKWESFVEAEGCVEIRVDDDLRDVSADVIARACFGSSYCKGKEIFSKLRALQKTISKTGFLFALPNLGLFPTSNKDESRSLEREIESLIWETVREREKDTQGEQSTGGRDLLQLILEGVAKNNSIDMDSTKHFIVDNCKNIYFAGHESTAVVASWCLMLLAQHPEWQSRIREETSLVFPDGNIDAESLSKLKMVTMVIQETMRLYPPAAFVSREALEETQLGHITVPKGVCIWTLIPTLHRDTDIWGPDANVFNPERFANGISGASKVPQAYIPFGLGPRLCLGRNFAMVQLKVVLSLVISKFCFSLSPRYRHSPTYRMIVVPGDGVQLLVRKCKI